MTPRSLATRAGVLLALVSGTTLALGPGLRRDILRYREDVEYLVVQHLQIVGTSMAAAIAVGVVAGIVLSRPAMRRAAGPVMAVLGLGTAIPTLAVLALAMTVLGIGNFAASVGLWLVSVLPIVRNTHVGLTTLDPGMIEAAEGMGMGTGPRLLRVELPNALPVIAAGIRIALVLNVGTAPLAFLIGGGGLGELIFTGLALNIPGQMLAGAFAVAALAVLLDTAAAAIQYALTPAGLRRA
jgi:osmoprotectant transport system permease protein